MKPKEPHVYFGILRDNTKQTVARITLHGIVHMSSLCIYNKSRLSHDVAHTMNLFIQMDFTIHIEKISMELSILYF